MLRTVFLLRVKVSGCCYYRRITRLKMTSHCGFAAILVVTDNLLYRTSFLCVLSLWLQRNTINFDRNTEKPYQATQPNTKTTKMGEKR